MRRLIAVIVFVVFAAVLTFGGNAFAGGNDCSAGDPGCKPCGTTSGLANYSGDSFQRGTCDSSGTENTTLTTCENHGGHPKDTSKKQCPTPT